MKNTPETTEIKALKKVLQEISSNVKNTVAQYIKAGELLTKIKAKTKYGDWDDVLQSIELSFKTAQRYMSLWENRTQVNLKEVKTLSDAENIISQICDRIGRLPIPTTQNQPLTHEKKATSPGPVRSDAARIVGGGQSTQGTQNTTAQGHKTAFDADKVPRDYSRAYVSGNGEPVPQRTKPRVSAKAAVEHGTDQMGWPLPDRIADHFKARLQIGMDRLRRLDALHAECMAEQDGELSWMEVNSSSLEADFQNLRTKLSLANPYAVCPWCQGELPETCGRHNKDDDRKRTCDHRGWVSRFFWDNQVEKDLIAMRVKAINALNGHGTRSPAGLSTQSSRGGVRAVANP